MLVNIRNVHQEQHKSRQSVHLVAYCDPSLISALMPLTAYGSCAPCRHLTGVHTGLLDCVQVQAKPLNEPLQ